MNIPDVPSVSTAASGVRTGVDLDIEWMLSSAAADFVAATRELVGGRIPDSYMEAAMYLVEDVLELGCGFEVIDGVRLAAKVHDVLTDA